MQYYCLFRVDCKCCTPAAAVSATWLLVLRLLGLGMPKPHICMHMSAPWQQGNAQIGVRMHACFHLLTDPIKLIITRCSSILTAPQYSHRTCCCMRCPTQSDESLIHVEAPCSTGEKCLPCCCTCKFRTHAPAHLYHHKCY